MFDKEWETRHLQGYGNPLPCEEVMVLLAQKRPASLLDIGCGSGWNMWWAAQHNILVAGVDGSAAAIKAAGKLLAGHNHQLKVLPLPVPLPWPDNTFEAAIDIECLYCLPLAEADAMHDEIYRVLKPDSNFLVRAHDVGSNHQYEVGGNREYRTLEDMKYLMRKFTMTSLHKLIRDYGPERRVMEWVITAKK